MCSVAYLDVDQDVAPAADPEMGGAEMGEPQGLLTRAASDVDLDRAGGASSRSRLLDCAAVSASSS
ncbi:hypothetical protein [Streptomyces sp. NBC_00448]|uniref:hypothetical protein n=1 Tax=Streptomyces sp. NBC_00448 TaxID=2903652 RepID=UPI002E1F17FD